MANETQKSPTRRLMMAVGMSATVDIETETVYNVISVPIQSVTVRNFAGEISAGSDTTDTDSSEDGSIVPPEDLWKVAFAVEEGTSYRREVETGISDNTHIQIPSGVSAGEEIVVGSCRTLSRDLNDGDNINADNSQFQRIAGINSYG